MGPFQSTNPLFLFSFTQATHALTAFYFTFTLSLVWAFSGKMSHLPAFVTALPSTFSSLAFTTLAATAMLAITTSAAAQPASAELASPALAAAADAARRARRLSAAIRDDACR